MRYVMNSLVAWSVIVAATLPISAQNETTLREYFEGTIVVAKIDMPGTSEGIGVHPGRSMPVDFRKVAQKIKSYGTSVHMGQSIMISKVHVKKKLIEFQLGGGGFGTFTDYLATNMAHPTAGYYEGKSKREKNLEVQLAATTDAAERQVIKEQIDDQRRDRRRNNAWTTSMNAQTMAAKQADEMARRAQSGSRLNIRFDEGVVPPEALTPSGLMQILSKYLDFPKASGNTAEQAETEHQPEDVQVTSLRKGLTLEQVEKILGPAATAELSQQGTIEVMTRTYTHEGQRVEASFVGGILVNYAISPE